MVEFIDLPDIQYVPDDAAAILQNIITTYEGLTDQTLQPADPRRLFLSSLAAIIVQQRVLINQTARINLLRYATGSLLDHMGAPVAVRLEASAALVTQRFTLSIPLTSAFPIPVGTRIGPQGGDGSIYFETTEYMEIPAGVTSGTVTAQCSIAGTAGNGFLIGQINTLLDPLPFVQATANTTESSGGAAAESDNDFRERIRKSPESYSTAGSKGAYEYWAKTATAAIMDVYAFSPAADHVTIVPLLAGGEIPGSDVLQAVADTLEDRGVRPLTDLVTVTAPTPVTYNTQLTYYISRSRGAEVLTIQAAVTAAVSAYQLWQRSKLGRHINPSELIARVMAAGALRVAVTSPVYSAIQVTEVAKPDSTIVTYGGLTDD